MRNEGQEGYVAEMARSIVAWQLRIDVYIITYFQAEQTLHIKLKRQVLWYNISTPCPAPSGRNVLNVTSNESV
jgi:hypothetical protein